MARSRRVRHGFNPSRPFKAKGGTGRYAQAYKRHPATAFAVDVDAVREALRPAGSLCTGGDDTGQVSGGEYARVSEEGARRVAGVLNTPEAAAAVRAVYRPAGEGGRRHRGNGVLVDASVITYSRQAPRRGKRPGAFRSFSTHVDSCPNGSYGSKVSAFPVNLLVQLDGGGRTGLCPHPPDKRAHKDAPTQGYTFCAAEGAHTCAVGTGLAVPTSVAHTPLPQTGRKLVVTLYFPPPRGCKSLRHTELDAAQAWDNSEENGWRAEGRQATRAYTIPWVVGG